ncbi:uncharacterized protein LOC143882101 [Tasmannia lanceolata]|uniref:uncharacterized protein LOC143882101 n=1 Tax=Tasmannia lanceolata TaxID=3420 RepID=UPI0040634C82
MAGNHSIAVGRDDSQNLQERESARWSVRDTNVFIDLMVEEVKKGSRCTTTFTKRAWNDIRRKFYDKTSHNYTSMQFKNKFQKLRKDYREFKKLLEVTGFGWNPITKTVTAEASVWDTYIQEHPTASRFKKFGCPRWMDLQIIYGDTTANGEFAIGNAEDPPESDDDVDVHVFTDIRADEELNVDEIPNADANPTGNENDSHGGTRLRRSDRTPNALRRGRNKSAEFGESLENWDDVNKARTTYYNAKFLATSGTTKPDDDPNSIGKCVAILNDMEVSDEEWMNGVKLFRDADWRQVFIRATQQKRLLLLKQLL